MKRRAFLMLALLALAGCASLPPASSVPDIYVMRHLHTPKGVQDPDLTEQGQAAASALAQWLSRDPPAVIYVSNTKRAQQTAAPSARRYGITPIVYDPADTAALVGAVLEQRGTVLVVGHSNTVPDIIAGVGGSPPGPLVHEDFGDIWHLRGMPRTTVRARISPR